MNTKNVYILQDRAVIYVNGDDAASFLQNIISNDIGKVSESYSCFASLLSPQGKFLYEFIVIKHKSGYLIDCEKSQAEGLFKQLSVYKLRSKVKILNLSNEFVVAAFSYEKFLTFDKAKNIAGFTLKFREDSIFLDPRNKQLGARLIINLEKLYLSLKKLDLHNANINDYYSFSHELGIVPKNLNRIQNKAFGIECNYYELNGIDFKKGCYVGQENTARIKLKNKLTKRVLPIDIVEGKLHEGEGIFNNDNEIGKVLINEEYPFALIKFLDKNFDESSVFKTKDGSIRIKKPNWIKK
tara:strand:+ start:1768 stop:2658 length:891 start_codon:yes stop_codon:yes gene_type:complete